LKICGIALRGVGSHLYEPEASLCIWHYNRSGPIQGVGFLRLWRINPS